MKWQAFITVMREPLYSGIVLGAAFLLMLFAVRLPQWSLIYTVVTSEAFTFVSGLVFLWTLLGSLFSNFTTFSLVTTFTIAILTGVLVALSVYSYRQKKREAMIKRAMAGSIGVGSGALGLGCAACGSLAFSSLASSLGLAGVATLLPFGGKELTLLGIIILGFAINQQLRTLVQPKTCLSV